MQNHQPNNPTPPFSNHQLAGTSNAGDESFELMLNEQRREITDAKAFFSDRDLAYNLQMEEALSASRSINSPHKNDSSPHKNDVDDFDYVGLMLEDLERLERERSDREVCEKLTEEMRRDLDRRIHDQKVANEILNMPDNEWDKHGDNFNKPYGESSSNSGELGLGVGLVSSDRFKVYCKGILSEEMIREKKVIVGGVGVAICDWRDNVIFEVSKGLEVNSNNIGNIEVEIEAVIQGLNAALSLGLHRIRFICDDFMVYFSITGAAIPEGDRISTLVNQVSLLQRKFTDCQPYNVLPSELKFAFELARNAIVSQITWDAKSSGKGKKRLKETCVICCDDKDVDQMFSVNGCLHRYCFSCMKKHVEVKVLNGMEASCPHEGCKSEVSIENCGQFVDPKLVEIMSQRKKEKSVAVTDKVYCPQMRCSALMSKSEVLKYTNGFFVGAEQCGARKCMKCGVFFCINCRVPWHYNMTCVNYKTHNPRPHAEDAMLDSLAKKKLWRQCTNCNHVVELAEGCYHITCRCGYEFCYTCGAPWKNKKPTCRCRIWDERNIIRDRRRQQ